SRGSGSARSVASVACRSKASSKWPADLAPNSEASVYSAPVGIDLPGRPHAIYFRAPSLSAEQYSSELPVLRQPTADRDQRIRIAELPNVLRSELRRAPTQELCADRGASAAFGPQRPRRPE